MGPGIGAVHGHINGDVPNQPDSLLVGIIFQCAPLFMELKLQVLMELHIWIQLLIVFLHGRTLTQPDILGPRRPGNIVVLLLDCHEQGIIRQPPFVFPHKMLIVMILCNPASLISFVEQCVAVLIQFLIIYRVCLFPKINGVALLLMKDALLYQRLKTDEIRISCKGRKRLVRRIPIACRP